MKLNDIILLNAAALNAGGPGSGRQPGGGFVNRGSTKTAAHLPTHHVLMKHGFTQTRTVENPDGSKTTHYTRGGDGVSPRHVATAKTRSDGAFQLKNTTKGDTYSGTGGDALDKHLRSKFEQG